MGKTALLILDLQQGIVDRVKENVDVPTYIDKVNKITKAAQAANVPAIYVRTGFRTGYPEISSNNAGFARVAGSGVFTEDHSTFEFHKDLVMRAEDIVVTKRRVSAFTGSDLEVVLSSLTVDHIVVFGISTSSAVLSTVNQACDMDYRLTVLGDMCVDPQPEVGKLLLENVLNKHAGVSGWEEWVKGIGGG